MKDRTKPLLVAVGVGAVGFDHQRVAPVSRVIAAGEIGMHDLGHVAKQRPDGV